MSVVCPYCGNQAKLTDSEHLYGGRSYGLVWDCRPCDAYVGVHKNSKKHAPLGRLANKELRAWKIRTHATFDALWKSGRMSRKDAYRMMQQILGIGPKEAHIGMLDVEQCRKLVDALKEAA